MPRMFQLGRLIAGLRFVGLAVVAGAAGACGADSTDATTEVAIGTDSPAATDPGAVEVINVDEPAFLSSTTSNTPFGFWRLEYEQLNSTWTSLHRGASPSTIKSKLEQARRKGARVFVQFAGRRKYYQNSDGSFSLTKFKNRLAAYKSINLDSYINDGTLAGHQMIDEPSDKSNWGGRPMSYSQVEAAAKASKAIWPRLPTLVRTVPSWLKGASFKWYYLDAAWAQYSARKGDVYRYRDAEVAAAKGEGLNLVWGLNVIDGGDGSSGRRGTSSGKYNMSASELKKYGKALLYAPRTCGFLMWMYDGTYLGRSGVMDAMKTLSSTAKSRTSQRCNVS